LEGYTAEEQCPLLDDLFVGLSKKLDVECIFINRAFACAIPTVGRALWGDDNAHTSPRGAYLIACTFFATIFGKSATLLDADVLTPEEARPLQEFADQVALEGLIPWKN
jgi:hypothetical protein